MVGDVASTVPADPRLADYRDLRDVELRLYSRPSTGCSSPRAQWWSAARCRPATGRARSWWRGAGSTASPTCSEADAPCYLVGEEVAEQVAGFHVHRGALAAMARRPLPAVAEVLAGARPRGGARGRRRPHQRRCDLPRGRRPRAGAALLSPRCADPLYRRSVKVAMGAVFALPWTRLADWYDALSASRSRVHHGRPDPVRGRRAHRRGCRRARQGRPGPGVGRPRLVRSLGVDSTPVCGDPDAPGIDSLNVAAATAVACYETARRRNGRLSNVCTYPVRVGWGSTHK